MRTKNDFHDQLYRFLMDRVDNDDTETAQNVVEYADYFFDDHDLSIKKARFALRLQDELNSRMSYEK